MTWSCQSRPTSSANAAMPTQRDPAQPAVQLGERRAVPEPDCRARIIIGRQALQRGVALAVGARERGIDAAEHLPHQRADERGRDRDQRDVLQLERDAGAVGMPWNTARTIHARQRRDQRDERRERDRHRRAAHEDPLLHRARDHRR